METPKIPTPTEAAIAHVLHAMINSGGSSFGVDGGTFNRLPPEFKEQLAGAGWKVPQSPAAFGGKFIIQPQCSTQEPSTTAQSTTGARYY